MLTRIVQLSLQRSSIHQTFPSPFITTFSTLRTQFQNLRARTFHPTPPYLHQKWSEHECRRLLEGRQRGLDWDQLSAELPDRSIKAIKVKYLSIRNASETRGKWSPTDAQMLKKLTEKGVPIRDIADRLERPYANVWQKASTLTATRSGSFTSADKRFILKEVQRAKDAGESPRYVWLAQRLGYDRNRIYRHIVELGSRRGPWTKEEDEQLRAAMEKHGDHSGWARIAKEVPGRTQWQCMKRWRYCINPEYQVPLVWGEEMDLKVLDLLQEGLTIREIAKRMGNLRPLFIVARKNALEARGLLEGRDKNEE
ncbi:Myblike DNAbinding domain-containing protein [Rhizophlyctis rosea]|uniref:Myblike DNAbinding domain-containing protein n=1 Tax=Rhizophlyctis rosea TaxID=64517 RepID=A0AAD5SA16_9FUNG|nr:Myblike DNAbinding domain-containing protein [Rhizophlyctis rosea]